MYGFGLDPDYNPTLFQTLSVDPTWRASERLQLSGHLGAELELTDSDVTSFERQPLLEDTTVTGAFRLPSLPLGLIGTAALRLALPTSKEAIARRRIVAIAPAVSAARPVALGRWTLTPSLTLRATANWQLSTTLVYDGPTLPGCDPARSSCEAFEHSGQRSAVAGFAEVAAVRAELPAAHLTLGAQIWWTQAWLYDLAPVDGPDGQPVAPGARNTDWRLGQITVLAAEWQPRAHWRFGAGLETQNPVEAPDGGLYWPFLNRFTQLTVTATAVY